MKSRGYLSTIIINSAVWIITALMAPLAAEATVDSAVTSAAVDSVAAALSKQGLTPEIAGKLSGDQILRAMKASQDFRLQEMALANKGNPALAAGTLVPIVGACGLFTTIILVVLIPVFLDFRRNRLLHETLRAMVEKGMEIPAAMLAPQTKQTKSKSDLRTGVIAVSAGLGITLFFLALNGIEDNNLWGIGLIPLIIGIGYIVVWKMESKKGASETRES
jgi:hypothetical protein